MANHLRLADQRAPKALFTRVVYSNNKDSSEKRLL